MGVEGELGGVTTSGTITVICVCGVYSWWNCLCKHAACYFLALVHQETLKALSEAHLKAKSRSDQFTYEEEGLQTFGR